MVVPLPSLQVQAILILLVVGNAQGLRGIRLSSEELVSARVVRHLDFNSSNPSSNALNSTKHTCTHPYGFLPCASNIPGFIFQIVVLEYLLLVGDKILTKGRQQLFSILGVGIYGATVFRILTVLPTIVLVLASGLAQNKDAAQARIENGAGTLAGSTVFYLTLQWGICVILGRTKITKELSPPQQESSNASTPAGCLRVCGTFRKIDKDNDDHISKDELREFLANKKSGHLAVDEEFAIKQLMKHFDQDSNHLITVDEFLGGV
ncbi:hypothetical protein GH714_003045 [Hevea brasiliensis]|uniref:EF-hand domain-containing protein n=1 Tax=Hevea brasiliensis TaxID=3981 RepID=A0A6A6LXT7_HEVBR|nr:hypothetical protein GH714_003045 [Hevea brasiliensis]